MVRDIVITGAASGLGKGLTLAFASGTYPSATIYACDRLPRPEEFSKYSQIVYQELDVLDHDAIGNYGEQFDRSGLAIELWIHCIGVRGLVSSVRLTASGDVAGAETLQVMDTTTMMRTYEINTLGFFLLAQALVPSLQRGTRRLVQHNQQSNQEDETVKSKCSKVVIMGSRLGSIGHNTSAGSAYAYRASKAALNAIVKSLSVDVAEVMWTVIHPGRVETGLVAVKEDGAMSVEESLSGLLPLITERLGINDSGTFIDRFGEKIPW